MSLDLLTPATPRLLITDQRNNLRWIVRLNSDGALRAKIIARADGSPYNTAPSGTTEAVTSRREVENNISSGLWAINYLCNEQGGRATPLSEEEWVAVCNALRVAREAKRQAEATLSTTRDAFRAAEAALTAANNDVIAAEARWNAAV